MIPVMDSEDGNRIKKLSILNLVAFLSTAFSTVFQGKKQETELYTTAEQQAEWSGKENTGVAAGLITSLKDGVTSAGDTLLKLYNLIQGAVEQYQVANIAGRNALDITKLNCSIFVTDDGDGKWAIYKPTTLGVGATFIKTMDEDSLAAVMSAAQIKIAYESNADTNAFTNALKAKLDAFTANFTSEQATKLENIAAGAQVNVIESLKIDGKLVPITSKELSISVDDSVTVDLTGGVMTVKLSDKYKNLIYAGL